ncbi:two-component regulator propeller domain-containing protein [Pseudoalteromonas xiamenensis]|uniref:two-component regulator propeller domain-containing protein n=1 Tax=Pseudoalteromonas xiamenensis TaxID=882626 RepID=UPI0027E4CB58|nr:two-component regulator propeller domain-containing protein [Pseudoalteromonas xiamenensis]
MRLIITILFTMLTLQAWGTPNFSDTSQVMKRYDYDSGLSQVSVTALAQDQFGYIWIGTQAGLNRFDGHEFKQFVSKQQNKNSLAGDLLRRFATKVTSCG